MSSDGSVVASATVAASRQVERYHLSRTTDTDGYDLVVHEIEAPDPDLVPVLTELDLLTYSEPTFSRFTLGMMLRHGRVFTVTVDGMVIGACHCVRDYQDPDEVVIFNMALRPGWRGDGLGTRFLYRILTRLQASGARAVTLQVAASNQRAIAVYQSKFGFELIGTHENEFNNGQTYLHMRLDLTAPVPEPRR